MKTMFVVSWREELWYAVDIELNQVARYLSKNSVIALMDMRRAVLLKVEDGFEFWGREN